MKYLEELRLYEAGTSEPEIAELQGGTRSTIQFRLKGFRKAGILTGNHKYKNVVVDWDKTEGHTKDNTSVLPKSIPKAIQGLSLNDMQILGKIIDRERSKELIEKRGKKKPLTIKVNEGVIDALKAHCEAEGISQGQLIEDLIIERIGQLTPAIG